MRLNPDCVRDILLRIEACTNLDTIWSYEADNEDDGPLACYSLDEILYHVRQCDLSGYLVNAHCYESSCDADYLSPAGHAFLADVRSDTVWNHTKTIAGKIGAWSMDTLSKIAGAVIAEIIKKQLD